MTLRTPIDSQDLLELSCDIASYILEDTYLDNLYEESESGNEVYTEEAQERFVQHLDIIEGILMEYLQPKKDG
jgi:hypothetical protein